MKKRDKIIYWIATIWLAFGMTFTGVLQLIQNKDIVENAKHMGYPLYFLTLIGIWKILGAIAVLLPKFPLVKEWAYAGFIFTMTGAIFTHLAIGDPLTELIGPSILIVLTVLSWYFRPADRKVASASPIS